MIFFFLLSFLSFFFCVFFCFWFSVIHVRLLVLLVLLVLLGAIYPGSSPYPGCLRTYKDSTHTYLWPMDCVCGRAIRLNLDTVLKLFLVLSVGSLILFIVAAVAYSNEPDTNGVQNSCWAHYTNGKFPHASTIYFGLRLARFEGFGTFGDDDEQGSEFIYDISYSDCSSTLCNDCGTYGTPTFIFVLAAAVFCIPIIVIMWMVLTQFPRFVEITYKQQLAVTVCAFFSAGCSLTSLIIFMAGCFPDIYSEHNKVIWGPGAFTATVGMLAMSFICIYQGVTMTPPQPPPPAVKDAVPMAPYPFMVSSELEM